MPVLNYKYITFKFDKELKSQLQEVEYEYLKRKGLIYIDEVINEKTSMLNSCTGVFKLYFSKRVTIIYITSIVIVSFYSLFMIDIKEDWNSYLGIIPSILAIWVFIYTIQFGLGMFKTFDSLGGYKFQLRKYYEHHMKLIESTTDFSEYKLKFSNIK
jgi:hypothetical protein